MNQRNSVDELEKGLLLLDMNLRSIARKKAELKMDLMWKNAELTRSQRLDKRESSCKLELRRPRHLLCGFTPGELGFCCGILIIVHTLKGGRGDVTQFTWLETGGADTAQSHLQRASGSPALPPPL